MTDLRRRFILAICGLSACFALGKNPVLAQSSLANEAERNQILRGPLKISADETNSKEHGKLIEATGNVFVTYDLDSGDRVESTSQFARYDEKSMSGDLTGSPRAVWKRKDPKEPEVNLSADKIFLKIKDEELHALGNVRVRQASSTLTAEEVSYSNPKKLMVAQAGADLLQKRSAPGNFDPRSNGLPEFDVEQPEHHTIIRAENIRAQTEKKQINFTGRVQGTVQLHKTPQ